MATTPRTLPTRTTRPVHPFRAHKGKKYWMTPKSRVGNLLDAGFKAGQNITFHGNGESVSGILVGARSRSYEVQELTEPTAWYGTEAVVKRADGKLVRVLIRGYEYALG